MVVRKLTYACQEFFRIQWLIEMLLKSGCKCILPRFVVDIGCEAHDFAHRQFNSLSILMSLRPSIVKLDSQLSYG